MSMLDSFFSKGFKAAKCKTLLKLTIPRIKLLRNRREVQLKQMRRDIAKLLETGQEATARIRVEHIIREENMMAAQEILELFCELIAVRLPIIETQRECPLDLKEAISSVCFAAPRCADLPELLQVQMLFASKYGKEFVAAATELRPDCGVNRQLIEALSVRAPSADKKLKLLKEIAEEHELDWNPEASETELFKSHEDLLHGLTQLSSGSNLSPPEETNYEKLEPAVDQVSSEKADSDEDFDILDFPEVPKGPLQSNASSLHPNVPHDTSKQPGGPENPLQMHPLEPEEFTHERSTSQNEEGPADIQTGSTGDKQFLPFITPPSPPSVSTPVEKSTSSFERSVEKSTSLPPSRTKSEANIDLQDVLAAAQAAAETAERAAAAARSAASLAQVRISELANKKNEPSLEDSCDNPFYGVTSKQSSFKKQHSAYQAVSLNSDDVPKASQQSPQGRGFPSVPPLESPRSENDALLFDGSAPDHKPIHPQPQRLSSMEDDPYSSYPNLFGSQNSNVGSTVHPASDNNRSSHEF